MNRFPQMSAMTGISRKKTGPMELSPLARPWACRVAASKPRERRDMTHSVLEVSFLILSH